jgi:2-hydroxycyclohexanecarboxyl-CoA dehydrogenase
VTSTVGGADSADSAASSAGAAGADWAVRGPRGLALVSGGSGTIGRAICLALLDDGWGVAVGYVSRSRAAEFVQSLRSGQGERTAQSVAGRVAAVPLDLSDPAAARRCAEQLIAHNGAVDVVVFNGGVSSASPFHRSDETNWRHDIAVNFLGTVTVSEAVLPSMVKAGWGRLIGITSEAAKVGDVRHASYSAAKAAQAAYLSAVAVRVAGTGVTANSIAPGPIESPLLRDTFATPEEAERAIATMTRMIPARRVGEPEDIAEAVRFFVDAGAGISGQHMSVGGGITMQ